MSCEATDALRALRPMRERLVSVPDAAVLEARRDRVLPAVAQAVRAVPALRARARRRRLGLWVSAAAAAALVAVATPGVVRGMLSSPPEPASGRLAALSGAVVHRDAEGERAVRPGETLGVLRSGEVQTGVGARARLESGGTHIELGEESTLRLEEPLPHPGVRSRVELRGGWIRCSVAPLSDTGGFSVVTPDAVVTVHGTIFSVGLDGARAQGGSAAAPGDYPVRTCVRVESGVVTVQHAGGVDRVPAGGSWGCGVATRKAPAPEAEGAPTAVERGPDRVSGRPGPTGTLAEENRLFEAALAAERRGEVELATRTLEGLLRRYPGSPLAGEARAALARLRRR